MERLEEREDDEHEREELRLNVESLRDSIELERRTYAPAVETR
jgi:hypothetical protein